MSRRLVPGGDAGHFGWFKPGNQAAWETALAWLQDPARPVGEPFPAP